MLLLSLVVDEKIKKINVFQSFLDSNVQPKFYCVLSPEASEDDISRLDSKVRLFLMKHSCVCVCMCLFLFTCLYFPALQYVQTTVFLIGLSKAVQWSS